MGRTIKGLQERRSYKIAKNGLPQFTSSFQGWGGMSKKATEAKRPGLEAEIATAEIETAVGAAKVIQAEEILMPPTVAVARMAEEPVAVAAPALPTRMDVEMEAEETWAAMITTAAPAAMVKALAVETPQEAAAAPAPVRVDRSAPVSANESAAAMSASRESVWRLLLRKLTFRRPPVKVRTVQTELALERVAVVRNDLSDDDLEVRPRKAVKERNPFKAGAKSRRTREAKEEKAAAPAPEPELAAAAALE